MSRFEFKKIWPLLFILLIFDLVVWYWILLPSAVAAPEFYFLDVGQGDSQLIRLPASPPGGPPVEILIDGGPDSSLLANLGKILSTPDHYLDLVLETHPQQDHFGGFIELLRDYQIGAYLHNGRTNTTKSYTELQKALAQNGAPKIVLAAGDKIKYQDIVLEILSPAADDPSRDFNETCLVSVFKFKNLKILYTCDISTSTEKSLINRYDLGAQVFKVPHHGSKKSSGREFLKAIKPQIAIIEVGRNSYGHPTKETLDRLQAVGAKIYRTDQSGLIKLVIDSNGENAKVYRER